MIDDIVRQIHAEDQALLEETMTSKVRQKHRDLGKGP